MTQFARLVEARGLITLGLGEAGPRHEEYIDQFRQMAAQIERLYPLWLSDRKKSITQKSLESCDEKTPIVPNSSC